MPREVLDIRNFHTGLITNADDRDIPVDAGADGTQNLDPNVNGKLAGAKNIATKHATYGKRSKMFGWIERTNGKRDLIGVDDTDIRVVTDFYGTLGETTSTADGKSVMVEGKEARIGANTGLTGDGSPHYVGWITNDVFNGKAYYSGLTSTPDSLNVDLSSRTNTGTVLVYVKILTPSGILKTATSWARTASVITVTHAGHTVTLSESVVISDSDHEVPYGGDTRSVNFDGTYTAANITANTFDITVIGTNYAASGGNIKYREGATDSFKFSNDDINWSSEIYIKKNKEYTLNSGSYGQDGYNIIVFFDKEYGHTAGDQWKIFLTHPTEALLIAEAKIDNYMGDTTNTFTFSHALSGTGTTFTTTKKYYYGVSLMYDGAQETPINYDPDKALTPAGNALLNQITFYVNWTSALPLNKRVTGVNVYMAESDSSASEPSTFFRLVKSFLITGGKWRCIESTGVSKIATRNFEDNGVYGASYEASSGITETLDNTFVGYGLSAQLNGYHFVGNCYHPELDDASHMLFRSKVSRYDMFD